MPTSNWNSIVTEAEKAPKSVFEPLADGNYNFVIEDKPEIGSTAKGFPKISLKVKVESGDRAGARPYYNLFFTDKPEMNRRTFETIQAMGVDPSVFHNNPSDDQLANEFLGKRFAAHVSYDENTQNPERPFLRLSNISPATSSAPRPGVPQTASNGPTQSLGAPAPQQAQAGPSESPWSTSAPPAQAGGGLPMPGAFRN